MVGSVAQGGADVGRHRGGTVAIEGLVVGNAVVAESAAGIGQIQNTTVAEQNAERVSGQIDELMALSNSARGGAKAAQETADAAIEGVNVTNQRISSLDDYVVQSTATVNFKTGSAVLSQDSKTTLDQIAQASMTMKGYVIEITGFTDATGSVQKNKVLSQRRAQAVIDYLVETHNIPLRRIGIRRWRRATAAGTCLTASRSTSTSSSFR